MPSRDQMLKAIRQNSPVESPIPDLAGPWIAYPDKAAQFASVLTMIGGRCVRVKSASDIQPDLDAYPEFSSSQQIVSLVSGVQGNIDLANITDPHQLNEIDFAVLPGEFGVAENAAVWVHDQRVAHRVAYFICQHLALVIPTSSLIDNMHEAYEKVQFSGPSFGTFIAGPSKTADIEQSLVIGAHGPRSMTVYLVDEV